MFPLTNTPEISRPCLFTNLMELDCDSILCSVWRPKSDGATRKEVTSQEKFLEFFKLSPFQRLMSGRNTAPLEATATARKKPLPAMSTISPKLSHHSTSWARATTVAYKMLDASDALGGVKRITFQMSSASLETPAMKRSI